MNKYEKPDIEIILWETENFVVVTSGDDQMVPEQIGGSTSGSWSEFI